MNTTPQSTPSLDSLKLLTAEQVAELLGVRVRSIWWMASAGQIPKPVRIGSRITRWKLSDIQTFLAESKEGPQR